MTGLPASGKNTFAIEAKKEGFLQVVMGDVIREECRSRGLTPSRDNSNKIMLELRETEGNEVVAKRTMEKISRLLDQTNSNIIIDGIRSLDEVNYFKKSIRDFKVIAVHASPKLRFERTISRQRGDDPIDKVGFNMRDLKELRLGIGSVIALADYLVSTGNNLSESIEKFHSLIKTFGESL